MASFGRLLKPTTLASHSPRSIRSSASRQTSSRVVSGSRCHGALPHVTGSLSNHASSSTRSSNTRVQNGRPNIERSSRTDAQRICRKGLFTGLRLRPLSARAVLQQSEFRLDVPLSGFRRTDISPGQGILLSALLEALGSTSAAAEVVLGGTEVWTRKPLRGQSGTTIAEPEEFTSSYRLAWAAKQASR